MGFLDWLFGSDDIDESHLDEVWVMPSPTAGGDFVQPDAPVRVYHVKNATDGREWTSDRNSHPHIDHRGERGHLTECIPPFQYSLVQMNHYGDSMSAEQVADDWNRPAHPQGSYVGSMYTYSASEASDELDKYLSGG